MGEDRLYDVLLALIGVLSALWCVGLSVVVMALDSRRKAASLNALTASFSRLLAQAGQRARDEQRAETL